MAQVVGNVREKTHLFNFSVAPARLRRGNTSHTRPAWSFLASYKTTMSSKQNEVYLRMTSGGGTSFEFSNDLRAFVSSSAMRRSDAVRGGMRKLSCHDQYRQALLANRFGSY